MTATTVAGAIVFGAIVVCATNPVFWPTLWLAFFQ